MYYMVAVGGHAAKLIQISKEKKHTSKSKNNTNVLDMITTSHILVFEVILYSQWLD